jgi:hypothetical protein
MVTPRNIVATVNLDCRLDLKTIALHARNAEYNPKVLIHALLFFSCSPLWVAGDLCSHGTVWLKRYLLSSVSLP